MFGDSLKYSANYARTVILANIKTRFIKRFFMTDILLTVVLLLQIVGLALIFVLWRRQDSSDGGTLKSTCDELQKAQGRLETLVREEMLSNRREAGEQARAGRDEVGVAMGKLAEQFGVLQRENGTFREHLAERLGANFNNFANIMAEKIESSGAANKSEAAQLRSELFKTFDGFSTGLSRQANEATARQDHRFEQFEQRLAALDERSSAQIKAINEAISERLEVLQRENNQNWDAKRAVDAETTRQARAELHESLRHLSDSVSKNFSAADEAQRGKFEDFFRRMDTIAVNADKRAEHLRGVVDARLQSLQDDNSQKLEAMRQTVDEKLQGTLNERLGESFKAVSERLELVHAGLGEMRVLANGVGDLKKVLTNVKTRGNWGEIQLGNLLEQMLTPQQYGTNVATVPGSNERVEFAIRLPGQDETQEVVWLPIDAKFPQENYARLVDAHEAGEKETIEVLGKQLEAQIKKSAQEICSKYVCAPHTTDFAILFLPTEGLYAEVIRRTDLVDVLQRECRITIAGPTTLASILNALQMGFRTLTIQQRSSEIWRTLSQVKTEFGKYGDVLDAVQKKLNEASKKIDDTRTRSRAIERKLRDVEVATEKDAPRLSLLGANVLEEVNLDGASPLH